MRHVAWLLPGLLLACSHDGGALATRTTRVRVGPGQPTGAKAAIELGRPVTVLDFKRSCSCLGLRLDGGAIVRGMTLDEGEHELELQLGGHKIDTRHSVMIDTDRGRISWTVLVDVQYDIECKVAYDTALSCRTGAKLEVPVIWESREPGEPPPELTLASAPRGVDAPQRIVLVDGRAEIHITLDGSDAGVHAGILEYGSTAGTVEPMHVRWRVEDRIEAFPPIWVVRAVDVRDGISQSFDIRDRDRRACGAIRVETLDPAVAVTVKDRTDVRPGECRLTLEATGGVPEDGKTRVMLLGEGWEHPIELIVAP